MRKEVETSDTASMLVSGCGVTFRWAVLLALALALAGRSAGQARLSCPGWGYPELILIPVVAVSSPTHPGAEWRGRSDAVSFAQYEYMRRRLAMTLAEPRSEDGSADRAGPDRRPWTRSHLA